ncbi:AAA family ATPase [Irregularibacter muris]|uniref:DNA 3'-5' helicase n=1 Tax=Irregularibacter muris TaxID=1796619 RepID=A0AAE3HCC4_9FIRM|nr:RNA polymerase recycling motor HelD [Irregularibacter muris]MCR1897627.1 AAA family ATPase [Irregularibacter muris]
MHKNDVEWDVENERLRDVLKEIKKQFDEKRNMKEKFKQDTIETQKEMWQNVGALSISNGLDQIAEFMTFTDMIKTQKRSYEFTRKLQEKYEKMLLSPYFGRMDFLENGESRAEKYYIGISNLINDHYDFLVYDWRAPVCSMFYDYEIGEANYICPDGIIDGKLTLKRQYKINNGKLEYMFDSNLKIDDEILQDILGKSTDNNKMKTIITTIQREQNKVIRNEKYKNLIVQGPAGSGKTSIALHRIAYLLYKHRDKITSKNIVIFSPNEIFNDYISNVLPQLGEDNMNQTTFKDYMHKVLGSELIKEDYCAMMEYILTSKGNLAYQSRIENIKYKSSMEFIDVLKQYVAYIEKMDKNFKDIIVRDRLVLSSKDLQALFLKDYRQLPLKRRLQKIRARILFLLEPYEKQMIEELASELEDSGSYVDQVEIMERSKSMIKNEMENIYHEISRMTEFDLVDMYKKLFEKLEFFIEDSNTEYYKKMDKIKSYTLDNLNAGRLNYEEQPPLLYLKGALGDLPKTSEIKYVIIDEAQDYTPLQYEIFYQLFQHADITILGDLNQSINPFMNLGNYHSISQIFPENNTLIINLTKSYRSTMEITQFSRKLLNKKISDEYVERSGEEPLILGFSTEGNIKERIIEDIKLYKEKGYKSIGIITRTAKEAEEVYRSLKDKIHVKAIMRDDDEYVSDTLVIPSYLAKGLEFDVVLIYNAGNENYCCEEDRLLLYTACTRALHVLCIYYSGKITPLLEES